MDRRSFLKTAVVGAAGFTLTSSIAANAFTRTVKRAPRGGGSPYGSLRKADANGIKLPSGFTSCVLATSGAAVAGYAWHGAPDGGATFTLADGGWVYVSNSEIATTGGASSLRFASHGSIVSAQRILSGTNRNCAGGPTPWGTWLSCEETDGGRVFECHPLGSTPAVVRPALGLFSHEAAAVDSTRGHVYLTEDKPDGRFYRFTPLTSGDLSAGALQVAAVDAQGLVTWLAVPNPQPTGSQTPTRQQVSSSKAFNGGEGAWYGSNVVHFTTKGDNKVWAYNCVTSQLTVVYDVATASNPILSGVDTIVVARSGDLFIAEDGGDMQLIMITPDGAVWPFMQITNQSGSEIAGPAFDPSGSRLYLSSQRGKTGSGITYEIKGSFRS